MLLSSPVYHTMTSSNGNIFRVTGPLCGEFTGDRWIPLTKASDAELSCFLWSAHIYGWVDNCDAGGLRRHRAHYDVIVMSCDIIMPVIFSRGQRVNLSAELYVRPINNVITPGFIAHNNHQLYDHCSSGDWWENPLK